MGSLDEDVLDVCSHFGISKHFVALIDHKKFALNRGQHYLFEGDKFAVGKIVESAGGRNDDVRVLVLALELSLVLFDGDASEVAAESEFLEVSAWVRG